MIGVEPRRLQGRLPRDGRDKRVIEGHDLATSVQRARAVQRVAQIDAKAARADLLF